MKKISASCLILLDKKKRVLLIKRDNNKKILFPGKWSLVGGASNKNETPKETVMRECYEELNIEIKNPKKFLAYESIYHIENVFWIQLDIKEKDINLQEGELFKFFSRDELKQLDFAFSVNHLIEIFFNSDYV